MSSPVVIGLPGNERLATALAAELNCEQTKLEWRRFPDGESYLRFEGALRARQVVLACTLHHPDTAFLPLVFAAMAARDLGAERVGLAAPYLAYMRQDRRFRAGEAVTSAFFARLLSDRFDWIVTVDPHLHRYRDLGQIYSIPVHVVHAAPILARYLRGREAKAFLIGPDEESEQWVAAVAAEGELPYTILRKERRGDKVVEIALPDLTMFRSLQPVLIDDIISSGSTMNVIITKLLNSGFTRPLCLAVHGIFADSALRRLVEAGAERVLVTNTIDSGAAQLDIYPLLAQSVAAALATC
jgi:ribose-phosphate pyrophosphokinase